MPSHWHISPRVKFLLPAIAFAIGTAVFGLVLAFLLLDEAGRRSLLEQIGRLCAQFIVLVMLALIVTQRLENLREREADRRSSRDRKESHVRRLIDLTHNVDLARLLISANRSVKTWSVEMSNSVLPAYTELRDLKHDFQTAAAAHQPVFERQEEITAGIQGMVRWFSGLSEEYAENKKALSELQHSAENDRGRQAEVWQKMQELPFLGDLVSEEPSPRYGDFRKSYLHVLTIMRSELAAFPSNVQGN